MNYRNDPRFSGIEPFERTCWLSSPTMHGKEQEWVDDAIRTNWVSTVGANIDEVEKAIAEKVGRKYSVGLASGTAALHLAIKFLGEKLYGKPIVGHGSLEGKRVFCSDMTFEATVNPILYEGGIPVFIDTEVESWNMDPVALEKAFEVFPDVKLVVIAHLYGTPTKIDEIKAICNEHGALLVEDAAESLGSTYNGIQTGTFGDASIISFNGNKIITGSSGGIFLCDSEEEAKKIRKWSTQSREDTPWYLHEELGYNYRMSNIIAGVVRGQLPYLEEHIAQKKAIRERYAQGLADLPVSLNPIPANCAPNYWLTCLLIEDSAMEDFYRGDREEHWTSEPGKSCPGEILSALKAFGAEGRPIWKPMHQQPIYKDHEFITADGKCMIAREDASVEGRLDVGADIFRRGLCLPSDNKMTAEQQDKVIEIIHRCFA